MNALKIHFHLFSILLINSPNVLLETAVNYITKYKQAKINK